jgi:hypothetical protein
VLNVLFGGAFKRTSGNGKSLCGGSGELFFNATDNRGFSTDFGGCSMPSSSVLQGLDAWWQAGSGRLRRQRQVLKMGVCGLEQRSGWPFHSG